MAKRKAGVNNIIFELDNEDIEVSSDEEVKEPKINRLDKSNSPYLIIDDDDDTKIEESCGKHTSLEKSCEKVVDISTPPVVQNGGQISLDFVRIDSQSDSESYKSKDVVDCVKKLNSDHCKATILNEDIVIDSPGNSDLGVEVCESRTPLVTVRFKNKKIAVNYKQQIKAFLLNLLKLHENTVSSDYETDLELDIWPEDLNENLTETVEENVENSLYFVDTDPADDRSDDIPRYSQTSSIISNIPDKEPTPPPTRRGPTCFNCDGSHALRDCPQPRDFARIANKRKSLPARVGRYHIEDEQKFGHLIPGRISGHLRHALGLKRHSLPLHIYKMRQLGYPPGWLEEARISHSGISMFDSSGNAILEADDEEGELIEPGSKDKFDIKKILDFPGFNVPPSPRYKEESHTMGLPPMADQDSKLAMLQFLAPNAMKAYKRKKLSLFPSVGSNNATLEGQAEMELDSGDELTEFPSVPPLPDDAPPSVPPPPTGPPPPAPPPPSSPPPPPPSSPPLPTPNQKQDKQDDNNSEDDLEVIEVLKVGDIPIPIADFIVIDEDNSELDETIDSARTSPSLVDLEAKKQLLLDALEVTDISALDNTAAVSDEITNIPNDETKEKRNNVDKNTDDSEKVDKTIDDNTKVDTTIDDNAKEDEVKNNNPKLDKVIDDNAKVDKVIDNSALLDQVTDNSEDVDKELVVITDREVKVDRVANKDANMNVDNNEPEEIVIEDKSQELTSSIQTVDSHDTSFNVEFKDTQECLDSPSQIFDSQETITMSQAMGSQESLSSSQFLDTQENTISKYDSQESGTSMSQYKCSQSSSNVPRTPDTKTGFVRDTEYGTPVMNIASSYVKLPSDDKFAKDICDVINFENLPNSTGKYKKISALLKKVKSEVDRIQDS